MKIFILGAPGYIGGTVAQKLIFIGHEVYGLARDKNKADKIEELGQIPVVGTLDDLEVIHNAAANSDVVINAASTNHVYAIRTIIDALKGTNKTFIHTSGSSVVSDYAGGSYSHEIFNEYKTFSPLPEKAIWYSLERDLILASSNEGVRTIILCPCMIFGYGTGLRRESIQLPLMIQAAKSLGKSIYIGEGENIWSNVHIDDCANAYLLALENAQSGSLFYLESGQSSIRDLASAVGKYLKQNPVSESVSLSDAYEIWGPHMTLSLCSNSRITSEMARKMIGWSPKIIFNPDQMVSESVL